MKPVDQTIIDEDKSNCMQAVLATLFEQKFEDTIDIYTYPEGEWLSPFMAWLESIGYEYQGVANMFVDPVDGATRQKARRDLCRFESIGGYFYGVVNSRRFESVTHAVVIDALGVVVHDPNPGNAWLGVDTIATKELLHIYTFGII